VVFDYFVFRRKKYEVCTYVFFFSVYFALEKIKFGKMFESQF